MWRRIFRTTISAACELTVPNSGLCFIPAMRVLYHNNTTCPDGHVRAPESLTIISLCTQRDLLEAAEKCRCTYNTSIETLQNYPLYYSFQFIFLKLSNLFLLIINIRRIKYAVKMRASFYWDPDIWICILFLPARRSPPPSITKGRLECSLSGYHSKVKERFKFSFEKREAHDLFSQRVIFLSLRSGRQKPLRETRRLSLLSRGPGGEGTSLVFGQRREECASWRTEGPPAIPRTSPLSPFFTFALLAIIIRVLWLRGLNGTEPLAPV